MGSVSYDNTGKQLMEMFQDESKENELRHILTTESALFSRYDLKHIRVYTPGDELPLLKYMPINDFEGEIDMSGMHKFPIRKAYKLPAKNKQKHSEMPDSVCKEGIIKKVFKGSLEPTIRNALSKCQSSSGETRTWSELGDSLAVELEILLKRNGVGIYYLPICRVCVDQYRASVDDIKRVLTSLTGSGGYVEEAQKYRGALFSQTSAPHMEKSRDYTRVTPLSHPLLRPFTDTEEKTHEHIMLQRQHSILQQRRTLDRLDRSSAASSSAAASSAALLDQFLQRQALDRQHRSSAASSSAAALDHFDDDGSGYETPVYLGPSGAGSHVVGRTPGGGGMVPFVEFQSRKQKTIVPVIDISDSEEGEEGVIEVSDGKEVIEISDSEEDQRTRKKTRGSPGGRRCRTRSTARMLPSKCQSPKLRPRKSRSRSTARQNRRLLPKKTQFSKFRPRNSRSRSTARQLRRRLLPK